MNQRTSNKKKKISNRKIRARYRVVLICVCCVLGYLLLWPIVFHISRPATVRNTYVMQGVPGEYFVSDFTRGPARIYFTVDEIRYCMVWCAGNRYIDGVIETLEQNPQPLYLTVRKHIGGGDHSCTCSRVHQVVDLRSDSDVISDITLYNQRQSKERKAGIGLLVGFAVAFLCLAGYFGRSYLRRFVRRR